MATLLRHDPDRQVPHHMDAAGWVAASVLPRTETMKRFGKLNEEDLRMLIEIENYPKARFLMAWEHNQLYIRAAQGHSGGVSDNIDMSQALEVAQPGDARW
eukprot:13697057-Alexandrium_andersonii.AAC.1